MSIHNRFIVAVDLGKRTHVASILNVADCCVCKTVKVSVDAKGFSRLDALLSSYSQDPTDFVVGCEATGHYGETLLRRLQAQGYPIVRLNPAQVAQFRKGLGRRAKNDRLDAEGMALQLAVSDVGPEFPIPPTVEALRRLTRLRCDLVSEQTRWVNRVRALLNQNCPEVESLLGTISSPTTLCLLSAYPSRRALAEAPLCELTRVVEQASRGYKGQAAVRQIKQAAQSSVGLDDLWLEVELRMVIRQLQSIRQSIGELEAEITDAVKRLLSEYSEGLGLKESLTIVDFPYGSYLSLGTLFAEIGPVERFPSLKHLLGYLGWCPETKESGSMKVVHPRMSRTGNRFARRILWMLAVGAVRRVPEYHSYYQQRVAEGKSRMKTLIAVGRKLLCAIFAILRTGVPYDPNRYLQRCPAH